jgi:TRAP-type C4-dicarboxylate transport system permease small subunit
MGAERLVQRLENGVETVIKCVVVTLLAVICVNVFVQVILRYVFFYSSRWTLEVSRYMMIWAVLLAAGPALKRGFLVGIDMVVERLTPRARIGIACLLRVVMGVLAGTILVQAIKLVQSQFEMEQMSPALEIPIAYMSMALPVGLGVFLFFLAVMIYNDLLRLRRA